MNLFGLWRQNCSVFVSWSRPSSWSWDSRGEIHFPRTPISYSVPGFHFPWVAPFPPAAEDFVLLTCPPAAANSSPPASRAAAEGLRSAAFTFVAPAPRCPLRLPPNRAVRSHPLRGAYRAFSPGGNAVSFHIPGIMRNYSYISDIFAGNSISVNFLPMSFSFQLWLWWRHNLCSRIRSNGGRASPHPRSSASRAAASRAASCRGMAR